MSEFGGLRTHEETQHALKRVRIVVRLLLTVGKENGRWPYYENTDIPHTTSMVIRTKTVSTSPRNKKNRKKKKK